MTNDAAGDGASRDQPHTDDDLPVRVVRVRPPLEPVAAVAEADAVDAALRDAQLLVRGPVFGVVAQTPQDREHGRWRTVQPIDEGCPQLARDGLNTLLWHQAYDLAAKCRAW